MTVTIDKHEIGDDAPVFVIAEAGVNHNGDLKNAFELLRLAGEAGADCVKFQTYKAERVVTASAPKAHYQMLSTDPTETQIEMLRKLELDRPAHESLVEASKQSQTTFLSTPYNEEDADLLDDLGVGAFKLASIHAVEPGFLKYVADKGKPIILSTGMTTLSEVDEAVRAVQSTGNDQLILLHCTTNYPTAAEEVNLRAMLQLMTFGYPVGFSDHTQTDTACLAAVALGARVIEKHFTLDKHLPGPDHSSSVDPVELARLVSGIREAEVILGKVTKAPTPSEIVNAKGMRRSIVARRKIRKGEVVEASSLTYRRPASGLRPSLLQDIEGRCAARDIEEGEILAWEAIGERPDHSPEVAN